MENQENQQWNYKNLVSWAVPGNIKKKQTKYAFNLFEDLAEGYKINKFLPGLLVYGRI